VPGLAELVRDRNTARTTANDNVIVRSCGRRSALRLGTTGAREGSFSQYSRFSKQGGSQTHPSQLVFGTVVANAVQSL
jgi:hypothetical protein